MRVWNMRGGEVGDAVSVCMCSIVAVDMNARDMGRWGCCACMECERGEEVGDAVHVYVCSMVAVDMNARDVGRWGSLGMCGM